MRNICIPQLWATSKSPQLLLFPFYSPTLIKWVLFPQNCLVQYLIPQNPKLLLRNECRLFVLSTYQLWNVNVRWQLPHILMLSLSQDCNFKYYLIIFLPWWVQKKQKAVTKMQSLTAGGRKKKKKKGSAEVSCGKISNKCHLSWNKLSCCRECENEYLPPQQESACTLATRSGTRYKELKHMHTKIAIMTESWLGIHRRANRWREQGNVSLKTSQTEAVWVQITRESPKTGYC